MKKNRFFIIFILILFFQAKFVFSTSALVFLDKKEIEIKDELTLKIAVYDYRYGCRIIYPFELNDYFYIKERQSKIKNVFKDGKRLKERTLRLKLKPKVKGEINLSPFTVVCGKDKILSNSISIFVYEKVEGKIIEAYAVSDKKEAYTGEEINISYFVLSDLNINSIGVEVPFLIKDAWVEEFPVSESIVGEAVNIDMLSAKKYLIKKYAVFPKGDGEFEIPSVVFRILTSDGKTFYRKTEPLRIRVKKIADISERGRRILVGKFRIKGELKESKGFSKNKPFNYTVSVSGEGNIKALRIPYIRGGKEFILKEVSAKTSISFRNDRIYGERVWIFSLTPKKAGDLSLPLFCVWYFEPNLYVLKNICTESVKIKVFEKLPEERYIATVGALPEKEGREEFLDEWKKPFYLDFNILNFIFGLIIYSLPVYLFVKLLSAVNLREKEIYEKKFTGKIIIKKLKKLKKAKNEIFCEKLLYYLSLYFEKRFNLKLIQRERILEKIFKIEGKREIVDSILLLHEDIEKCKAVKNYNFDKKDLIYRAISVIKEIEDLFNEKK